VHGRSGQWEAIAAALGTGRPACACLREFATGLEGAALVAGVAQPEGSAGQPGARAGRPAGAARGGGLLFTPRMDEMLREQVQALGPRWKLIGRRMGLDSRSVYWRWSKVLGASQRRGAWSVSEDLLLLTGIARMGLRWDLVAQVRGGGGGRRL
jgi:hypothetical protein